MKRFIHIFSCFSLACVVLFASIGIPLNSMHCSKSGRTVVSVAGLPDCGPAPDAAEQCALSENCCDYTVKLLQLEVNSPVIHAGGQSFLSWFTLPAVAVSVCIPRPEALSPGYSSIPPPLTGRDILNLIGVYRI